MFFIVNTEDYYSLLWCSVLWFVIILLGISLTPLLYFFYVFRLCPFLHNPSLPPFCHWLTRTPSHNSSITHRDWLVPHVQASSWLMNLVVASALFVHVCCHVDVGVLCVVLVCEEHTVHVAWYHLCEISLKTKCVPQIQSWNKNIVAPRVCLLLFITICIHPFILYTHFSRATTFSIFFSTPRFGGAKQDSAAYMIVRHKTQGISFAPVYSHHEKKETKEITRKKESWIYGYVYWNRKVAKKSSNWSKS